MNISWKLFIPLLLLTIIISSGITFFIFKTVNKETICTTTQCPTLPSSAEQELEQINAITQKPKAVSEITVTGWIPNWDFEDGFLALKEQQSSFESISPVWFNLNKDGTLEILSYADNEAFSEYVATKNIELIPTIACFNAEIVHEMLSSPEKRTTHINTIVDTVVNGKYDGIDLDYESVYLEDKELFFSFLETLSTQLKEKRKKLVFTSVAKWGDISVIYTFLPQTRATFDYKRLSTIADEFRIMTYDYTSRTNKEYGPVAPISWVEDVIKYAIYSGVPREKLVIGIPTYAFDWSERPQMKTVEYYPVLNTVSNEDLPTALAYYNKSLTEIMEAYSVTITFNDTWGEAIGTYTNESEENRIVVFPTQQSFDLRKKLVANYGLKGVTYWRIGDEDGLQY